MKLYQTHLGYAITIKAEIGDTDDGWSVNDGTHLPNDARVEVVYRYGGRDPNLRASDLIWNDAGHPRDVVAYRIIKPKLQLEVGGIYRDRSGQIHGPLIARTDHPLYPFRLPGAKSWTHDGHYYHHVSNEPRDLVEHIATAPGDGWIAHNKNEMPSLPDDTLVEVVTRSGKVQLGGRPHTHWSWGTFTGNPNPILAYRVVSVPKLQLEVGGIYRDREGNIHGPVKAFDHHAFTFAAECRTWTAGGRYLLLEENGRDLVEHIATVPGEGWIAWNEPHCPFSYDNPVLEIVTARGITGTKARPAKDWNWADDGQSTIFAYRVVHPTPKLQLTLAERVAQLEAKLEAHLA